MAYYDEETNNTGNLTARLAHDAAKIQGVRILSSCLIFN